MKKLLIITTYYKPIQSVASNRMNAFAKYFNEFGYKVTVLTCSINGENSETIENGIRVIRLANIEQGIFAPFDTNIKENKFIHYCKCAYNIMVSNFRLNSNATWTEAAKEKGLALIKKEQFDFVLSSALPIGPHIVAMAIKERNPQILWIADMRDAISLSRSNSRFYDRKMLSFEKEILSICDYLLAVSKPQLNFFRSHYNGGIGCRFLQIRNGFDFQYKYNPNRKRNDIFTMVFTGSFYGSIKPDNFFKALCNVIDDVEPSILLRVIGNKAPINIPDRLKHCVCEEDPLSYKDICKEIQCADVALLIIPSHLETGVYSGKIFDYLGSCTPVIGLVPVSDVAAKLILDSKSGYVVDNEDIRGIEETILQAYSDWKNDVKFLPDQRLVLEHHRSRQVERLYDILENDMLR